MKIDAEFEAFVRARSTALLRTAYLLTGDRGAAEDLLQTTLLRVARRWSTARTAPEAYARTVLVNLSHDRRRALFRRPREAPLPPDPDLMTGVDQNLDRVAERGAMVRALAALPIRQRQVLVLRYFEDLSVEETAQLLHCTPGTVKAHASRGLARLRDLLVGADDQPLQEVPHAHR